MLESLSSVEARLVANEDYHLGRPAIDAVVMRFFPDYPTAQRELEAGTIDGLLVRDDLSSEELQELSDVAGLSVDMLPRAAHVLLYLNNEQVALFSDERVREALSLAIDREAIVDAAFEGLAIASSSVVAPGTWAYAPEFDNIEPDTQRALELLTEAGWVPDPTTGILVNGGAEFRITIRTDSDSRRVAIATTIKEQLEPLGIRISVASTTFAVLRRDFLQERNYEAAVAGWDQGADPDPYPAWHSSQATELGGNFANYADVVADRLIQAGRTSLDLNVRLDSYRQFQDVWPEETPSVILAYPQYAFIHSSSLVPAELGVLFTPADRFAEIHRWTN
jgi:peptide/nickel transport system substrate-binding protein